MTPPFQAMRICCVIACAQLIFTNAHAHADQEGDSIGSRIVLPQSSSSVTKPTIIVRTKTILVYKAKPVVVYKTVPRQPRGLKALESPRYSLLSPRRNGAEHIAPAHAVSQGSEYALPPSTPDHHLELGRFNGPGQ